ncbi:unnamed protein product [Mytilus coruscus]|uniref:SRCR domain-containing protein n=1 Tax=Mytilus coruscus TaxID=42192 RepID=A0A6J7ZWK7_MYTCO|nr:unnamed protein product [Mytilus coruscus]
MKKQQLLIRVAFALLMCNQGTVEIDITFHKEKLLWKYAANNCSQLVGIDYIAPSKMSEEDNNDLQCIIATTCSNGRVQRKVEECQGLNYYAICDNGADLQHDFDSQILAATECHRQGSFIKWYPDECKEHFPQPFWTGARRHVKQFQLRTSKENTDLIQLIECFKMDDENGENRDDCDEKYSLFCSFGKDEDEGNIISIPTVTIPFMSDDSGRIAAGIVTPIIAVIAIIIVLVFIHRRRLSKKKSTLHQSQKSNCGNQTLVVPSNYEISTAPIYNEIDGENFVPQNGKLNCSRGVNNITYDQFNNKAGQCEFGIAKVQNVPRDSSEIATSSNYCLAKPITSYTEEESDPYDISKDYDHLKKREEKRRPDD